MAIRINGDNTTAAPGITSGADTDTGVQFGTDEVSIVTGGTEQAKVDSSGRLLVGTSSDSKGSTVVLQGNSNGSTGTGTLRIAIGTSDPADGANLGLITFTDSSHSSSANIIAQRDGGQWTSGSSQPSRLIFSTTANGASAPTERMRIRDDGAVLIGDSIIADNLDGQGLLFTNGGFIRLGNATGSGSASMAQFKTGAGNTEVLRFQCDGDVENLNNRYGGISDINLKENIVDAGSQWDDMKNIRIRKYNLKGSLGYETHTQIGVIAQELELVCPGLVEESFDLAEDGSNLETSHKTVSYSVLYVKALKALQEAMERIETLESKVAALEAN